MHKQEKIEHQITHLIFLDYKTCLAAQIINKKEDKMVFLLSDMSLHKIYTLQYYFSNIVIYPSNVQF